MGVFDNFRALLGFNGSSIRTTLHTGVAYSEFSQQEMLSLVLSSPAMLKVICLQCDTFSMGKFYAYNDKDVEQKTSKSLEVMKNLRGTTKSQFLWDWMFWNMLGNVWLAVTDKNFDRLTKFHFLNPLNIEFPNSMQYKKIVLSKSAEKAQNDEIIKYNINGQTTNFKRGDVLHFTDMSNTASLGEQGASRLEALFKIIINSEECLASNKINTEFSRKFLVAGSVDAMDTTQRMMGKDEKEDIKTKLRNKESVHVVKSMVEIRRFVENMKNLELDKSYMNAYFLIGNMYNIPRDVLEAFNSSTYENQEKARGMHVYYTLDPKGEDMSEGIRRYFDDPMKLVLSFDHLPFVQVMELDREKVKAEKIKNLDSLLKLGLDQDEALKYLDLDFKKFEYVRTSINQSPSDSEGEEEQSINPGDTEEN